MSSTNHDRPRIALISVFDLRDVYGFSRSAYYMPKYFQKNWGDLSKIRSLGYTPRVSLAEELGEQPEMPAGSTIFKRVLQAER